MDTLPPGSGFAADTGFRSCHGTGAPLLLQGVQDACGPDKQDAGGTG